MAPWRRYSTWGTQGRQSAEYVGSVARPTSLAKEQSGAWSRVASFALRQDIERVVLQGEDVACMAVRVADDAADRRELCQIDAAARLHHLLRNPHMHDLA